MNSDFINEETHRLAQQLAELTAAVTEAVRERLERVRRSRAGDIAKRLLEIGSDCAAHIEEPFKSMDPESLLYDEKSLPK